MSSRRRFLQSSAVAAAAFYIVPRHVLGKGYVAPSDKLNIAAVGCGGKADDVPILLADPRATEALQVVLVHLPRDACRVRQAILPHGKPDGRHSRNIGSGSKAEGHQVRELSESETP